MHVALVTHASSLQHVTPLHHPERPERVAAAVDGVLAADPQATTLEARAARPEELAAVHDRDFLDLLERFCSSGGGAIDADTYAVEPSWDAARYAAGAGLTAIEAIDRGEAHAGFAAVRPPGHHAEAGSAMGFCLMNNVAVSAAALVARGERVAVVDWDVHHGNGTQDIFFGSPDVLYVSLHRSAFYPGTGRVHEVGKGLGVGTTVNIPLPAGSGGPVYRQAFARIVVPVLEEFDPDWLLVSAGYDGHAADPLGGMQLLDHDYGAMASAISATMQCSNTVFCLEGGYDLSAVSGSVEATIRGFTSSKPRLEPPMAGDPAVDSAVAALSLFWDLD